VGYVFGQYWDELLAVAKSLGYGVIFLVALALLAYLLRRRWSRNHPR
jgi:membrane-associated protein